MKRTFLALFISSILLIGCSNSLPSLDKSRWLDSGSLVISRPAPSFDESKAPNLYAFMPVRTDNIKIGEGNEIGLTIDIKAGILSITKKGHKLFSIPAEISTNIKTGKYSVILKQNEPLWYAPDNYFTKRRLEIPAQGSIERFRRGALGDSVIFFGTDLSIHSSPVNENSIIGARVSPSEIDSIYDSLDAGSTVIIR